MMREKVALIPAYEPEETLIPLVGELVCRGFSVVVVDDGSGEGWREAFDRVRPLAAVLSYSPNRGKGCALKTGLAYIAGHFPPDVVIVTLDADGQHTPEDACRAAEAAERRPGALTLGVRSFGRGTPLRSRFGNAVTRWIYRLSSGRRLSDTQTGLRAFGGELLAPLAAVEGERYEYEMNVLMECPRRGIPFQEVPIATIYLDNNRTSHFHTIRDSALIYGNILKFAASSLTGFAIDYSLYSLLAVLLAPLGTSLSVPIANVSARVVSASTNFALNKRYVFHSSESLLRTGIQYFALAAGILAGNTVLLSVLVGTLGWNKFAAKLVTELTFFTLSFLAQRFWIFRKARGPRSRPDIRLSAISTESRDLL